jgi:hypothetical protein
MEAGYVIVEARRKYYCVNNYLTESLAMPKHFWTSAGAVAILIAAQSSTAFAQPATIGNATATKNKVEGAVGSTTQSISKGSNVFTDEVVRTGDAAVADLQFLDETTMSIGPISEIRLDKFVYDPSGSSGAVVIQATRGAFRFVTGKQDKKAYQIKTPYGTLGIRG